MQNSLPRTFVNLVSVIDVALVRTLNHNEFCTELHKFECDCAAFPDSDQAEANIIKLFNEYTMLSKDLVDSGRYDTTDEFTVVLQPFLTNFTTVKLPDGSVDITYFAPDCFHFAAKTHGKLPPLDFQLFYESAINLIFKRCLPYRCGITCWSRLVLNSKQLILITK